LSQPETVTPPAKPNDSLSVCEERGRIPNGMRVILEGACFLPSDASLRDALHATQCALPLQGGWFIWVGPLPRAAAPCTALLRWWHWLLYSGLSGRRFWPLATFLKPLPSLRSVPAVVGFQPTAYSLKPKAYSLPPIPYSLSSQAYSLKPIPSSLQPKAYSLPCGLCRIGQSFRRVKLFCSKVMLQND